MTTFVGFVRKWQRNVRRNRLHERFTFEGYDLWDFLEPLLIGNSSLHHRFGFPQLFHLVTGDEQAVPRRLPAPPELVDSYLRLRSLVRPFLGGSAPQGRREILFLSSERFEGERHTIFGNLFDVLRDKGISYRLVEHDLYDRPLRRRQKDSVFIGQYQTRETRRETRRMTARMRQFLEEATASAAFRNAFRFDKDYLPELEAQIRFFRKALPHFLAEILILTKAVLERERPACVVLVSETDFYAKGIIQNARRGNLATPTVCLQFGTIIEGCDINPTIESIPTVKCVDSPRAKEVLVDFYHYPAQRIMVTGEPRYDDLGAWDREKTVRELGLDPAKPTVVFMDQSGGIIQMAQEIALALNELVDECNVLIKLHPLERNATAPIYRRHCLPGVKLTRYDTKELLNVSDVVVTCWSSTALETIMLKKPLILVNFGRLYPPFLTYDKDGAALRINDRSAFAAAVRACLHDRETIASLRRGCARTLRREYSVLPGSASSLIAERALMRHLRRGSREVS